MSSGLWADTPIDNAIKTSTEKLKTIRMTTHLCLLVPLSLHHKRRPKIRRLPLSRAEHFDLRRAQSRRGRFVSTQHSGIETLHQHGRGFVVHVPKTHNHSPRSSVHERTRQTHDTFAFHVFSQSGFARTQHNELCR